MSVKMNETGFSNFTKDDAEKLVEETNLFGPKIEPFEFSDEKVERIINKILSNDTIDKYALNGVYRRTGKDGEKRGTVKYKKKLQQGLGYRKKLAEHLQKLSEDGKLNLENESEVLKKSIEFFHKKHVKLMERVLRARQRNNIKDKMVNTKNEVEESIEQTDLLEKKDAIDNSESIQEASVESSKNSANETAQEKMEEENFWQQYERDVIYENSKEQEISVNSYDPRNGTVEITEHLDPLERTNEEEDFDGHMTGVYAFRNQDGDAKEFKIATYNLEEFKKMMNEESFRLRDQEIIKREGDNKKQNEESRLEKYLNKEIYPFYGSPGSKIEYYKDGKKRELELLKYIPETRDLNGKSRIVMKPLVKEDGKEKELYMAELSSLLFGEKKQRIRKGGIEQVKKEEAKRNYGKPGERYKDKEGNIYQIQGYKMNKKNWKMMVKLIKEGNKSLEQVPVSKIARGEYKKVVANEALNEENKEGQKLTSNDAQGLSQGNSLDEEAKKQYEQGSNEEEGVISRQITEEKAVNDEGGNNDNGYNEMMSNYYEGDEGALTKQELSETFVDQQKKKLEAAKLTKEELIEKFSRYEINFLREVFGGFIAEYREAVDKYIQEKLEEGKIQEDEVDTWRNDYNRLLWKKEIPDLLDNFKQDIPEEKRELAMRYLEVNYLNI